MATSAHYRPSPLPWQVSRPDPYHSETYELRLYRPGYVAPDVLVILRRGDATGLWSYSVLPVVLRGDARRSALPGHVSRDTCEAELLELLELVLDLPPSCYLPAPEGGYSAGKEADYA